MVATDDGTVNLDFDYYKQLLEAFDQVEALKKENQTFKEALIRILKNDADHVKIWPPSKEKGVFDIAFTFKNLTGKDVGLWTIIDGAIEPVIQTVKNEEEILHFRPEEGHITIKLFSPPETE